MAYITLYVVIRKHFLIFPTNSEAFASEFEGNIKESPLGTDNGQ